MNYNFGGGGGLGGAGAGGFQTGGFQQKQPAFGAQASQFSFGKPATASSGFNAPQQTGAFTLGGQTAATGIQQPLYSKRGIGGFGQQLGGFASPSTGFGGAKFGAGVGSGLGVGLGGLGGKTSPSSFGMSGGGLGGVFTGGATQQAQPFGFAPAAVNTFGAPQATGGMFGNTSGALGFGQQQPVGGMNLGASFGQQPLQGTGNPPFELTKFEEIMIDKNRVQKREAFFLHVITGQPAYEGKSQEELRFEDYRKGVRGPTTGSALGGFQMGGSTGAGAFGMQPSTVSPFGQPAASGFGGLSGGFGQPAAATPAFGAGSGMFGAAAPASGGMFGQQTTQSAFGQPQQQPSTGFSFGQPAAQPAAGGMFGAPAAAPAFGTTPAFGAAQPFGATPAFGAPAGFGQPAAATSAFGGLGGGFGGFGQPAAAAPTGFGAPAAAPAFGAFGAPAAKSAFGSFAFGSPTSQPAAGGMFGAPAAAPAFGAPAATNAFGAPAAALNFGAAPAFGAATSGFGDASRPGGLGGFSTAAPTGFGAAAAPAFSAAPTAATGGMFGSLGGFGQAPAASPAAFGGFGGFGATAAAKPFSLGFSAAPAATSSWGMSAGAFGAPAAQFGAFGAPVAGQQAPVQQVQLNPMEQKMELLRTKNQKLDIQLKDDRIYTSRGPDTASLYSTTTFSVPRSLPSYQHTSRSTAKIVPRGVISSATMTLTGLQRPLSSVLSAASSGGATADMMSPEKLLGRSAKRLIIVSSGFNNSDPTIDLPLPSYQQKQAVRALQNVTEEAVSPPRALMLNAHRDRDQRRPSGGYNGGDVTGLTPSNNRSPFTPTNGDTESGPSSPRTPVSGSDVSGSIQDRPSKAATGQRIATPYLRGEREMESLDNSVNSNSKHDSESSIMTFDAPMPPTLLRPGYITAPSMAVLKKMTKKELSHVRNFAVYRPNIGKIEWEGDTDVRGLDLDLIVNIEKRGVEVYDSEEAELMKPEVGQGLNKPAIVYLDNIFPPDDASELKKSQFLSKLKKICLKSGSEFMDYDAEHGQWSFRVEHFSRYGLDDSDDEEEPVIKRLPLPIRKSPIVLSVTPPVQGTAQDDMAMDVGSDDVIQTPVPAAPAAAIGTNKQYLQYTLSASGSNQADLERMRLSFSKTSSIPGEGTGLGLGLPMQSTIFTPRKVAFSASSSQPEVTEKAKQTQQEQQQQQQLNSNAQSDSANAMPTPESIPVVIAPTHEAYAEVMTAVRDAEQCPFHLTADSPCMQLLLQVKADYLSSTGQRQEVVKRQPVLTRVAGIGSPVAKVLQKHPVNAALSMGRSFRVGWGPNGEIVHAGQLLFNASDASYGKSHRVVVEKIETVRWVEEKTLGDGLITKQTTPSAAMDSCEAMLKVVLSHSFVFDCTAKADMDIHAPLDDLAHSKNDDENDDNGLLPTVPLWRAPYAKPWELNEYLPYLNTLEDLMKTSIDRNITSSNPDWVLSKAIELVAAVSGQEQGSYATAKQLYGYIGNSNKMGLNKQRIEQEQSTIQKLNDLRSKLDFMPLYEDREGHEAIDWERRREAISSWLVNITTVEVADDADDVDGEGYGQSAGTYTRIFQLLSCNRTLDAVDLAESAGLYRMSTLLSQIGGDHEFVRLISFQLDSWANSESSPDTSTIPKGVLDLYRLMGADPFPSDMWPDGSILKDIGWMRALGMIFWYCDSISSSDDSVGTLSNSLILYDQALQNDYVDEPCSPYVSDSDVHGLNVQYPDVKHGLYSLLQVFFRSADVGDDEMEGRILSALRTEGYTRDPLDYRAAYVILLLLECMGVASPGNFYASATRSSFISQLINEGYWMWGVFIAMQTPDDLQRAFIVKELVLRHAVITDDVAALSDLKDPYSTFEKNTFMSLSLKNNTDTKHQVNFLVNILHVPITWIHEAAAHRYGYSHLYIKQVQHLNFAQSWRLAKEIICTKLAPLILVRSSASSKILLNLLESMDCDDEDMEDDVWTSKSHIILSFLRLQSHVDQLSKETLVPSDSSEEYYHTRMITEDYNEILINAKSLLGRVQQLNTKGNNEPTIDRATLLNMGTYLFDLIDSRNQSDRMENPAVDLFDSTGIFENCLNKNYPVLADHALHSLHHHSSAMLKDAANRFSKSYIMSLSLQPVEMSMG